ncbi:histidine phosphatase family protein [Brevundimonas sp. M20]|uniref:SixA phosphatase family protein n=1 Tax=Brevundimonas sp. M20 TaxID=2591463 RepID=UPI00143CEF38|nr:phosphoglycerate mutase family protein [Brevundimonas sp. M20]
MKRLLLLAAVLMSVFAATEAAAQTVILVRHAEKAEEGGADPSLSEAGRRRATMLMLNVANAQPRYIITTPLRRTAETAAPLAHYASLTPDVIGFEDGVAAHVDAVIARVRALPRNAVVLVVGHSNTIPLIARGLGYPEAADMPECEFDRLTALRITRSGVHGMVDRYGERSACPASPEG